MGGDDHRDTRQLGAGRRIAYGRGQAQHPRQRGEQERVPHLGVGEQGGAGEDDGAHHPTSLSYRARCALRDRPPGVGPGGGRACGCRERGAAAVVAQQPGERAVQRDRIARGDELRRAGRGDLGEGADVGEQQRQPEGERRREHPGLLDLAVGQHGQVGAAEDGRRLPAVHEPLDEPHARGRGRVQRRHVHPRTAHDPQLGTLDALPCAQRARRGPCTGAASPKHRTTGPSAPSSSRGSGCGGHAREVVEHAVRDDLDPRGVQPDLAHEPAAAVLGEHDDGVRVTQQPPLCGDLAGPGLARQDVVGGQDDRPRGQQPGVELRQRRATGDARRPPPGPRRAGRRACPGRGPRGASRGAACSRARLRCGDRSAPAPRSPPIAASRRRGTRSSRA